MKELVELLGQPNGTPTRVDWSAVEQAVGFRLPADYKWCVEHFGWADTDPVRVLRPTVEEGVRSLVECHDEHVDLWDGLPEGDAPYPFHPEPGGLRLCAITTFNAEVWWDTADDDPDSWTVVKSLGRPSFWTRTGLTFGEYLVTEIKQARADARRTDADLQSWAGENGIKITKRGRIPARVIAQVTREDPESSR